MKTILYLASELSRNKAKPAKCNDLYKIIDKHLSTNSAKTFFNLQKWDQPTTLEVLEKIEEYPAYIHYCGHGDFTGNLLLQDRSLEKDSLGNSLASNFNLECVLLGSCNSDKLANRLKEHANYFIGFTGKPTANIVIEFYNDFYDQLAKHGSPFKAFWIASDKMQKRRTKTAGAKVILRSKINYIMQLIALNEELASLSLTVADKATAISKALNELASLQGEARSVFQQLLLEHPFAEDVFLFFSHKEKLAHDIANQIMDGEEDDDADLFRRRLTMAFGVLEKILVAYEQKELSHNMLAKIGKGMPKEQTRIAFNRLAKNDMFKNRPQGFRELLSESIQYCLGKLTQD